MKKSDLIEALAVKQGLKEKEAYIIVDMIFDGFTDTLKENGRIEIRGFGSFSVRPIRAGIRRPAKKLRLEQRGHHFSKWGRN
jgi:integration host factor subunit beta